MGMGEHSRTSVKISSRSSMGSLPKSGVWLWGCGDVGGCGGVRGGGQYFSGTFAGSRRRLRRGRQAILEDILGG